MLLGGIRLIRSINIPDTHGKITVLIMPGICVQSEEMPASEWERSHRVQCLKCVPDATRNIPGGRIFFYPVRISGWNSGKLSTIITCIANQNGELMKRNVCFVDTVCWIALLNIQDPFHDVADKHYKTRWGPVPVLLLPPLFSMKLQTYGVILHSNPLSLPFTVTLRHLHGLRLSLLIPCYGQRDGHCMKNGRINHGASRIVSPFSSCRNGVLTMCLPVTGISSRLVFMQCWKKVDSFGISDIWIPRLIAQGRDRIWPWRRLVLF